MSPDVSRAIPDCPKLRRIRCTRTTRIRVKGFASRGCRDRHTGMFYVYPLHSTKDNGFYIGYSTDLKRRLSEHTRGASFATKSRGPWKLIITRRTRSVKTLKA